MPLLALSLLVVLQTPPVPTPPFRRVRGLAISDSETPFEVGKDRFYVLSGKRLACYESGTGKLVWKREDLPGVSDSLSLRGSRLFLTGGPFAGTQKAKLMAIDAASGRTLWTYAKEDAGPGVAVAGATVFATFQPRTLAALDFSTGKEKWVVSYKPSSQKEGYAPKSTQVVASAKGTVAVFGNVAYGVDPRTGHEKWRVESIKRSGDDSVVRLGDTVVLAVGNDLRAYDIASGRVKWTAPGKGNGDAMGVIGPRIAVVDNVDLHLLDAVTGRVVGSTPIGEPNVYGSGRYIAPFGQAFLAEGTKYLLALDATGRTQWRLPVGDMSRPIWYGNGRMATFETGIWRLYQQGTYPPLPSSPTDRTAFAERQVSAWQVLDSAEKKQLLSLGDDLFKPLLKAYLATAKLQDEVKVKGGDSMALYRRAIEQAELLSKVTNRSRTDDLVAALRSVSPTGPEPGSEIGSGSGWQTLLTLLAQHGNPQVVAPIMVEELRKNRVDPHLMAYLNVALTYVSRSNHPEAVRYMISALRNPNTPDQIREAAYHNLAGVGGEEAVRAVLAERHRRTLLPSLESRMELAKVGIEPGKLNITNLVKIARDANGRTWGLMQSSVLGSYHDLWIAEKEQGKWVRPIFLGLTEDGRMWKKVKDPTPTFGGKTAKQWIEGDWVTGLTANVELRRDTDGDGLTDRMEARLGSDPTKADTDGDGDNDSVDPWPTVASKKPSTDEEAILAAALEARYHFESHASPAIFFAPPEVKPVEMVGWPGPVFWVRALPNTIADHPLTVCYGGGVGFLQFEPMKKDAPWPSDYMRFNKSNTEAELSLSTYFGGLNGTVYSVRVRKFGNDWLVVGMNLSSIS